MWRADSSVYTRICCVQEKMGADRSTAMVGQSCEGLVLVLRAETLPAPHLPLSYKLHGASLKWCVEAPGLLLFKLSPPTHLHQKDLPLLPVEAKRNMAPAQPPEGLPGKTAFVVWILESKSSPRLPAQMWCWCLCWLDLAHRASPTRGDFMGPAGLVSPAGPRGLWVPLKLLSTSSFSREMARMAPSSNTACSGCRGRPQTFRLLWLETALQKHAKTGEGKH